MPISPTSTNAEAANRQGRLIPMTTFSGEKQMAIDKILLEKSFIQKDLIISLRFYKWDKPTLSIGHNQRNLPKRWQELQKNGEIRLVRRPTGGSAVLHARGLTYALIWPSAPKEKKASYKQTSKWLINGFSKSGLYLIFGTQAQEEANQNCFSRSTNADLVDQYGNKRIGSAQLWKKGHLLQHGEILLDPPKSLWRKVFGVDAPNSLREGINYDEIKKNLESSLKGSWPEVIWNKKALSDTELREADLEAKSFLLY